MHPRFAGHALIVGLSMLIPLPFVDQWVERRLTARLLGELARARGTPLSPEELHLLVEDRESLVLGCLGAAVIWPLKKLFRTVLWFLTIKDVLDSIARAAHRATLVEIAFDEGLLPGRARDVRDTMDAVLARVRHSPVSRTLLWQPTPHAGWAAESGVARFVHRLQRQAGAGVVVPAFRERIARPDVDAPRVPPPDGERVVVRSE